MLFKKKKKIKTSEIRIRVTFLRKSNGEPEPVSYIFHEPDLKTCVMNILRYAELRKYKIWKMTLLTIEE